MYYYDPPPMLLIVCITGLWLLYLYILTFYFSLLYFTSTLIFKRRLYTSLSWVYRWFPSSTHYPSSLLLSLIHALITFPLSPLILYSLIAYLISHSLTTLFTGRGVYRMLSEMMFYTFYFYFLLSFHLLLGGKDTILLVYL